MWISLTLAGARQVRILRPLLREIRFDYHELWRVLKRDDTAKLDS